MLMMSMLSWLEEILPAGEFAFVQHLTGASLVVCFACIAMSVFFGIFASIFRR